MKLRGILFDKDDTIIDLETFWREPVSRLAAFLAKGCGEENNLELRRQMEKASGFSDGRLIPESPIVAGTNRDVLLACKEVLQKEGFMVSDTLLEDGLEYLQDVCIQFGEVRGTTDFLTLLPALKKKGYVLGIATSDHYEPTMHCLRRLGIDSYFDLVLSADRVEHPKPAPDMAMEFCRAFALQPEEVCMVGDSANDMRFAKICGIHGILFAPQGREALPDGAKQMVQDLMELISFL